MISRREFMALSIAFFAGSSAARALAAEPESILGNDVHSQRNPLECWKFYSHNLRKRCCASSAARVKMET